MASVREKVVEDCLDFIGGRVIFSDGLSRLQYFKEFEEIYHREINLKKIEYGKLFNISEITEFLVILTLAAVPFTIDDPYEKNHLLPKTIPFEKWKAADWKGIRANLIKLQTNMLRQDANVSIDEIFNGFEENREINVSNSKDTWFTVKLFKVLDLFEFHQKLAPFRELLEMQSSIEHGKGQIHMPLNLPRNLLQDFIDVVEEEEHKRIRKAFLSFFENAETYTLHSPATVRKLFDDPSNPHSFMFLTNRLNKIMRAWVSLVFVCPTITNMNSSAGRRSNDGNIENGQARALQRLQLSRERLNSHVEDPLASTVVAAATAKRKRRTESENDDDRDDDTSVGDRAFTGRTKKIKKKQQTKSPRVQKTMFEKKKSATRLNFTPEKENDIDSVEDSMGETLPDVKERPNIVSLYPRRTLKSQEKKYEGRRFWTDDEKNAIIEGVKYFGLGRWADIKKKYSEELEFRTSGQIKDCFRTMKRRGELGDLVLASPKKTMETEKDEDEKVETDDPPDIV